MQMAEASQDSATGKILGVFEATFLGTDSYAASLRGQDLVDASVPAVRYSGFF